ncbi:hypothetical protein F2Q68_00038459 [Brassica cretica]|uniref:PPM-type phosphatase domain-containing protein n=1 Tax=Brassica cretica TaxID=69181 RepID=A0A8S9MIG5_BRACR|nr:hypothetical protein F2Q68_00038459 [Brassica cretica]
MGNGVTKLSTCFTGRERFRQKDITFQLPDPLDEGLGHSFCYVRPDQTLTTSSKVHSELEETTTTVFRTISGASVSANTATPLSTSLYDPYGHVDRAAAFESTTSFPSIPLQPIPRSSGDDPIERGFLSGPIERGFMSGSLDDDGDGIDNPSSDHHFQRSFSHGLALRVGSKRRSLVRILRGAISKTVSRRQNSVVAPIRTEKNLKEGTSNDDVSVESQSLQWAQGKAGEDRVHVVVSEEHGWLFVGIYDGFNGPDAPDYLLSHLYPTLHRELKDLLLWNGPHNHCERRWRCEGDQEKQDLDRRLKEQIKHRTGSGSDRLTDHNEVLHALSEALRKTEEAYLDTADKMLEENPELALMGSCVLVMLMKGEDVYVMNVGDSRAVLGQRLERINEETMIKGCEGDPGLSASQLTVDHSTNVEEPEGDPAQHLVQELLFRAAKKAGIAFHELLEIPQGERRRYHDDVSIVLLATAN